MTDTVSQPPQGATTLRRRSLRGEPTSTLAPSTGAALAALVGRGQGIPEIATALALTEDAVRVKLKEAGLLELVEAPPEDGCPNDNNAADLTASPGNAGAGTFAETLSTGSHLEALGGPPVVIDQGPKRRGRGPNKPKAETAFPPDLFPPTPPAKPEPTPEDYMALGKLVAQARRGGATIEDMVADARYLLKLVELFGY